MLVKVITAHTSKYPDPISFEIGDRVVVGKEDSEFEGWIEVETSTGNRGWAPKQYIDLNTSPPCAVRAYTAHELDTRIGEKLELVHTLNDWGWCVNSSGEKGWIPLKTIVSSQSQEIDSEVM